MNISCTDFTMYRYDNRKWTDELLRHGVSHIDIAITSIPESEADRDEIITYALSRGLHINLHAPYGENNITSTDPARRASSIANMKASIDIAAKYGLGVVTFHPGRLSAETDDPAVIWADMMEVVADLAQYAKQKQVYVGIENMELRPNELVFTMEDLNRFAPLGEDNPYFGVTIDFAHYITHGIGLPDLSVLKLPIHNVHLSQVVDGKAHLALVREDGIADIEAICRLLMDYGYEGHLDLEIGPPLWESVEILENILKTLKK